MTKIHRQSGSLTNGAKQLAVSDIRPDDVASSLLEMIELDAKWLLSRSSAFIDVVCPACEKAEVYVSFEKKGFQYRDCSSCGTLFISPRPPPEILAEFYRQSRSCAFFSSVVFPKSEASRRDRIVLPRVRKLLALCREFRVAPDVLVEIGAGSGLFCEEMKAQKFFRNIIAVEPVPELARSCSARGIEVIDTTIEEADLSSHRVSAMVAFEVIEHLFSPKAFVTACRQQLSMGGVLVLSCPNIKGFDLSLLREKSDNVGYEHKNYFNPESLQHLLEGIGFDVVDVQTPGQLDAEIVRKKVLDGTLDLSGDAFLQQVLVEEWDRLGSAFQEFLSNNRLSSHLWVVARKRA